MYPQISHIGVNTPNYICNGDPIVCDIYYVPNIFYNVTVLPGVYKLEAWGASGGNHISGVGNCYGGGGGYSSGTIEFTAKTSFYVYIGSKGESYNTYSTDVGQGGWNGGGSSINRVSYSGGAGGGGSTDACTIYSSMELTSNRYIRSEPSYKSRFLVAGGGGGGWGNSNDWTIYRSCSYGGAGGGEFAQGAGYSHTIGKTKLYTDIYSQQGTANYNFIYVNGASQTSSGSAGSAATIDGLSSTMIQSVGFGSLGYGGNALKGGCSVSGGGGGAGWYGGVSGNGGVGDYGSGGSGGSGYVHQNLNPASNLGSTFLMTSPLLIAGNLTMPNPNGGTFVGNPNDGQFRITVIYSTPIDPSPTPTPSTTPIFIFHSCEISTLHLISHEIFLISFLILIFEMPSSFVIQFSSIL